MTKASCHDYAIGLHRDCSQAIRPDEFLLFRYMTLVLTAFRSAIEYNIKANPGDIAESQRDRTLNCLVDDDVQIGELTKEAEDIVEVDFVEIDADPLFVVAGKTEGVLDGGFLLCFLLIDSALFFILSKYIRSLSE
jgi:hypothetical protein